MPKLGPSICVDEAISRSLNAGMIPVARNMRAPAIEALVRNIARFVNLIRTGDEAEIWHSHSVY